MDTLRLFWVWWRERLRECLPGHAERSRHRETDGIVLTTLDIAGLDPVARIVERRLGNDLAPRTVTLDRAGAEALRAEAERARLPIVLALPAHVLLEREVTLPLAAERGLDQVVFHEMDRFTPFTAAEVIWRCQPLRRDRAQGKLVARLSLVPRAAVAAMLDALAQIGLTPRLLEIKAADGAARRIAFGAGGQARRDWQKQVPLLAGFAVLALVALVSPFFWQSLAFSAVDARIAANQLAVRAVQHLRAEIAAGATGAEAIAAERRRTGDALQAIALLTEAIPDDTYLTGLTYDNGTLTLDGQSKSAAALIGPLTSNPHFEDATFTAPVVRNALGRDSFSLKLMVAK